MKRKLVEQRAVYELRCHREDKFDGVVEGPKQECKFGFDSIKPLCADCRWLHVLKVPVCHGEPLQIEIDLNTPEKLEALKLEYAVINKNLSQIQIEGG